MIRFMLFALLAGCAQESSTGSTPEAMVQELTRIGCDTRKRCCSTVIDVDSCIQETMAVPAVKQWLDTVQTSIRLGGARWDAAAAERCVESQRLSVSRCSATYQTGNGFCRDALVGTVELGGTCGSVALCGPGLRCRNSDLRCAIEAREGEDCTQAECGDGLYCDSNDWCAAFGPSPSQTVAQYFCILKKGRPEGRPFRESG